MTEGEYEAMQELETLRAACRVLEWVRHSNAHAAKAYATLQISIRRLERVLAGAMGAGD